MNCLFGKVLHTVLLQMVRAPQLSHPMTVVVRGKQAMM
jgi:hypothetical protein